MSRDHTLTWSLARLDHLLRFSCCNIRSAGLLSSYATSVVAQNILELMIQQLYSRAMATLIVQSACLDQICLEVWRNSAAQVSHLIKQ